MSAPFDGAWGIKSWPAQNRPTPSPKAAKKIASGTYRDHDIAIRIQPAGDLLAFGDAFSAATGLPIGELEDGKRSVIVYVNCVGRSPQRALSATAFRMDRILKKIGTPIVRISWDVREVEA